MLSWPFKKKDDPAAPASAPQPGLSAGGDWDFLRSQPDHDRDEMASVHGNEGSFDFDKPAAGPAVPDRPPVRQARPRRGSSALEEDASPGPWEPKSRPAPAADADLLDQVEAAWDGDTRADNGSSVQIPDPTAPGGAGLRLQVMIAEQTRYQTIYGESLVGRRDAVRGVEPEIDLQDDEGVSRRHALILPWGAHFAVKDLNSVNGTRLNGRWLLPEMASLLQPGDEIELGNASRIVISLPDDEEDLTEEDLLLGEMLQEAMGSPAAPAAQAPEAGPRDWSVPDDEALDLGSVPVGGGDPWRHFLQGTGRRS